MNITITENTIVKSGLYKKARWTAFVNPNGNQLNVDFIIGDGLGRIGYSMSRTYPFREYTGLEAARATLREYIEEMS